MNHELSDAELTHRLREAGLVAQLVRTEEGTEFQFDNGSVLIIIPQWRGPCRVVFYTPDEANARAL